MICGVESERLANNAPAFIIPGTIGAVVMWIYCPDTLGKPLEETAALFGDQDEVAAYMRNIATDDPETGTSGKTEEQTFTIEKIE